MTLTNLEKQLAEALVGRFGVDRSSLHSDSELFSSGLLDSLKVMELISCVEALIGRPIPPGDISLDHFNSIRQIVSYVGRLTPQQGSS